MTAASYGAGLCKTEKIKSTLRSRPSAYLPQDIYCNLLDATWLLGRMCCWASHLSQAANICPADLLLLAMLLTVSLNSAKASRYLAAPSLADAVAVASPPKPSWSGAAAEMPKILRMRVTYAAAFLTKKG